MTDCLFCKIVEEKIPADKVFEDDQIVVFRDIHPKAKVHLLVVSREHINNLMSAQEKHDALLAYMLRIQSQLAKQEGLNNGFRTVINTGSGGGQEIDHLHFHLLGGGGMPRF